MSFPCLIPVSHSQTSIGLPFPTYKSAFPFIVVCYPLSRCFPLNTCKFAFPYLTFYPCICESLPYITYEFEILYLSIWAPKNIVYLLLSVYMQSHTCVFAPLYQSVLLYMHADLSIQVSLPFHTYYFAPLTYQFTFPYLQVYHFIPFSLPYYTC